VDLARWLPHIVLRRSEHDRLTPDVAGALREVLHAVVREDGGPWIHWVIVGGESGPKARPMDLAWARSLVAQGRVACVPVFVKQMGARPVYEVDHRGGNGEDVRVLGATSLYTVPLRHRAGGDPDEWPADLRVREFPEVR